MFCKVRWRKDWWKRF